MIIQVEVQDNVASLFAAAKARGVGPESLVRAIVRTVIKDGLYEAVLDDEVVVDTPLRLGAIERRAEPAPRRRPMITLRQREIIILQELSKTPAMWIGEFEVKVNAQTNWHVAMKKLVTECKVEPLPQRTGKRQYYRLRAQPPAETMKSDAMESSTIASLEQSVDA